MSKLANIIWEKYFFSSPFFARQQSRSIYSNSLCSEQADVSWYSGWGRDDVTGHVSVSLGVIFMCWCSVQYAVVFNIELYCITSQCNGGIPNLETHKTTNYHLNAVRENQPPSLEIQPCQPELST